MKRIFAIVALVAAAISVPTMLFAVARANNKWRAPIGGGMTIGGGPLVDFIGHGQLTVASGSTLTTATLTNAKTGDTCVVSCGRTLDVPVAMGRISAANVIEVSILRADAQSPTLAATVSYIVFGKR